MSITISVSSFIKRTKTTLTHLGFSLMLLIRKVDAKL
jgi:hypothetical protein